MVGPSTISERPQRVESCNRTIVVRPSTWRTLVELRDTMELMSVDAVIRYLLELEGAE